MALLLFVFGAAVLYLNPLSRVDLTLRAYAMIASGGILVSAVVAGKLFVPKQQLAS